MTSQQWTNLEGERRDGLPHVEGLSDRSLRVLLANFGRVVGDAARNETTTTT